MSFLIDEKYLADTTSISLNKNSKDIRVALQLATVIHVKPLLGSALFQVYQNHVEQATQLTEAQEVLLESIKYYLALKVEHNMLLNLVTISNKGATEEAEAASLEVVKLKRQEVESNAETVKQHILAYLAANAAEFPEFRPAVSNANRNPAGLLFWDMPKRWIQ